MKNNKSVLSRNAMIATLLASTVAPVLLVPQVSHAGAIADTLAARAEDRVITRKVTLEELGIGTPVTLGSIGAEHDIYIPVPAGVELIDPTLYFEGRYLRADGGQTTYTLSADNRMLLARSPTDDGGTADIKVGIDGAARDNGFVHLKVNWSSSTGQYYCDDARSIGNLLEIEPDTYLEYGYAAAAVKDISTAWSALPAEVTLLVSGNRLDKGSYDAAWRIGTALQRDGKTVRTIALPKVGDRVYTAALTVPPSLAGVPAFKAFSGGGEVQIANEAEIGALMLLDAPQFSADIAVADDAMAQALKSALDAVSAELVAADGAAVAAVATARQDLNSLGQTVGSDTVGLRTLSGRPVIAISPDAANAAVGLFNTLWRQSAVSGDLTLAAAAMPSGEGNAIPLGALGKAPSRLDVVAKGDWSTKFDLGAAAPGKVPSRLDINVSAAPGATATLPVASVSINGYLLGAKQLRADGTPERISVDIPAYTLLPRNVVNVEFQRQPASDQCREVPQAYPAAVLPDSRVLFKDAPAADNFTSLVARLAGDSEVAVPASWLDDALRTLPTVMSVADAAGVSPARAELAVVDTATAAVPDKPFLFFDIAPEQGSHRITVTGDNIRIDSARGERLFDATGLSDVSVAEAVLDQNQPGLYYRTVGAGADLSKPFSFGQGDVAIIGESGVLTALNAGGNTIYAASGAQRDESDGSTLRLITSPKFWVEQAPWALTTLIIGGFILLVLLAGIARRRNRDKQD
ncbi:cellulose biosynthesis cyclic di-GMP-binding regulatory protein BcsB [Martelella soudanensis]|uniref:cellulose biosynthesis cyclic di-GMP-binding regulatory protein BcsB n=1 Tax=unclassified Martelella TaxID=2629616 RepID=UPI0015DF409F|nr:MULTISPECIES: cellulose biosynthesis cyclic di-GMP-binding regulatory protein BcsB [unclassified Martelella]